MLKLNEKYTIVLENSLGIIVSRQVRINKIEHTEATYQKDESLIIFSTDKGKRKQRGTRFTNNKLFVLDGWQDIKELLTDEFICFDNSKFDNILKKYNPILKYNC